MKCFSNSYEKNRPQGLVKHQLSIKKYSNMLQIDFYNALKL